MVITQPKFNEKADQAFTRPATYSEHFNVSIRAVFGECNPFEHKSSKTTIDIVINSGFRIAIDMLAIVKMRTDEIIQQLARHIHANAERTTHWSAGIRARPRLHPYDEAELPMPTSCWIDPLADSPEDAPVAVRCLLELVAERLHEGNSSPNGHHVFVYALNPN